MRENLRHATTHFGDIAYTEKGSGPAALFVHGVLLNGYWWRHVIDRVADIRRCIAIDQFAHGATRTPDKQDVSCKAQAHMLEDFCAAMGLDQVDLIANDTGGSIVQIFAARYPHRIRSLTLTNCEVQDNWPPAGARLFFPEERPEDLAQALREHWQLKQPAATAPATAT